MSPTSPQRPRPRDLGGFAVLVACVALLLASLGAPAPPAQGAAYPAEFARHGLVAADAEDASQVGADILAAGGSAADAAVATALALGVVHPQASGLGGGGFVLYYDAEADAVVVLDFRERAPGAATREMFVVDGRVDEELVLRSGLAVGVPGELAGLWALHQRYGRLPWAQVVEPARRLAAEGFVVDWSLAGAVAEQRDAIEARPALAALLRDADGTLVERGDVLRNPALAATLARIAEEGPAALYAGDGAQAIVAATTAAGGILTLEDLARYEVRELAPLMAEYRGYTLATMPPPSSGGVTMLGALRILEGYDLRALGHNSSAYLHLLAEALQFAFADRASFLGDPAFTEVPVARLLDPDLAEARRALIRTDATLGRDDYAHLARAAQVPDDGGTSHLSVVDGARNMVALTTTVNTGFGAMLVAGDTGLVLNNEMADFTAQPGVPNVFGLIGDEANGVAPGKTPLSSMSPTLVFRDGRPFMALGGSGGPRIITATLQAFLNVVDFEMDVSSAVAAPRLHHQWVPELLFLEPDHPADVREALAARGHELVDVDHVAAVQAIVVTDEALLGASDPRKGGRPRGH